MRYLILNWLIGLIGLVALVACGPKPAVVMWASSGTSTSERIEIASDGEGHYTSATDGVTVKDERVVLSKEQLNELAEVFRTQHACELTGDPAYTPGAGEGKTTLELAFPDQHCKVVLWEFEWQHGHAKDITETMRSMRPLRPPRSQRSR